MEKKYKVQTRFTIKSLLSITLLLCIITVQSGMQTVSADNIITVSGYFEPQAGVNSADIYLLDAVENASQLDNTDLSSYTHITTAVDMNGKFSQTLTTSSIIQYIYIKYSGQRILRKWGSFVSGGISAIQIESGGQVTVTGNIKTNEKYLSVLMFKPGKTYADLALTSNIYDVISYMGAVEVTDGGYTCTFRQADVNENYNILVSSGDEFIFMPAVNFDESIVYGTNIYVSPNGNDNNSGTKDLPLKTMDAAKAKALTVSKTSPINIIFAGGVYSLNKGLVFGSQDSGTVDCPITYMAERGQKPLFVGSKSVDISRFKAVTDNNILSRMPDSAKGRVLEVDLGSQGFTRSMLNFTSGFSPASTVSELGVYYNGKQQQLARWPNNNFIKFTTVINGGGRRRYAENPGLGAVFTVPYQNIKRWSTAYSAYIAGFFGVDWLSEWAKVGQVDSTANTITLADWTQYGVSAGHKWYITNLLEEIDIPGEWYIDLDTLKLYYFPQESFGNGSDIFEICVLKEAMITVNSASNLVFNGLSFKKNYSNGIVVNNSSKITIKNCTVSELTGTGITLSGNNLTVDSSTISNTGDVGIYMNGCGNRNTLTSSGNIISNNHFFNTGKDSGDNWDGGVRLGGNNVGNIITNNLIHGMKNYSYSFGGNENIFQYNEVWSGNRETADSGPVYCGRQLNEYGNAILYNYIHDCYNIENLAYANQGIGTGDDWESGIILKNNIVNMGKKQQTFANTTHSRDNVMQYNIHVNSYKGLVLEDRYRYVPNILDPSNTTAADMLKSLNSGSGLNAGFATTPIWLAKYPQISTIMADITANNGRFMTRNNIVTDNVSVDAPNQVVDPLMMQISTVQRNLDINDYSIFVDAAHHDYRITSAAMQKYNLNPNIINENNFSMSQIGIQTQASTVSSGFSLTYPYNGQTNVDLSGLTLAWEKADFADEYTYYVATDPNFSNIVQSGKTMYNNVTVNTLVRNTKYYWKVIAKNLSKQIGNQWNNSNGVYSFTSDGSALGANYSVLTLNGDDYTAEAVIDNYTNGALNFNIIFASYDQFNKMVGINKFDAYIAAGKTDEKYNYTFKKCNEAKTVKMFLLENLTIAKPLMKGHVQPLINTHVDTGSNELVFDITQQGVYEESGSWTNGPNTGLNDTAIRVSSLADASARWNIRTPKAGTYRIYYWASPITNGSGNAAVQITTVGGIAGGGTVTKYINFENCANGWVDLGSSNIAAYDGTGFVSIAISGNKVMTSAIKLVAASY